MNGIQKAIDELVEEIALLQEAIKILQPLRDRDAPPPPPAAARRNGPAERAHRSDWRTGGTKIVQAVRTLPEPFDAGMIAKAAAVHRKSAQNFVWNKTRKGWLAQVTRGQYRRTPKYGQTASTSGQRLLEEIHHEIDATKPKED